MRPIAQGIYIVNLLRGQKQPLNGQQSKLQNLAIDDAWAMAGILYGFASQDDSHIHIKSTKMIIESLSAKKQHNTTRSSHTLLIAHQTIGRRIKERYV